MREIGATLSRIPYELERWASAAAAMHRCELTICGLDQMPLAERRYRKGNERRINDPIDETSNRIGSTTQYEKQEDKESRHGEKRHN